MCFCCRSWHTYEEEKNKSPRIIDFKTINEGDVFSRQLNEIHKCVLPKAVEYKVFKTQDEIEASSNQYFASDIIQLVDPRKNPTRILQPSNLLVRDYGYSSELSHREHMLILNSIKLRITHNPVLAQPKNKGTLVASDITESLERKRQTEIAQFNKCAEIEYYKTVTDLNDLISNNLKEFLIRKWTNEITESLSKQKFQIITVLLRDQVCERLENIKIETLETKQEIKTKMYQLPASHFPCLDRFTSNELEFYCELRELVSSNQQLDAECDISLSMCLLEKLLAANEEFSVGFKIAQSSTWTKCARFNHATFKKNVSIEDALEEIVKLSLYMSIDWWNISQYVKPSASMQSEFCARSIDSTMRKMFLDFKALAGSNETASLWSITGDQKRQVLINHRNCYFTFSDDGESIIPANISIKLEFQTRFGAETMTKNELLKEWCNLKFSKNSITLRYRVDAKTLKILSVTRITIDEVENELKKLFNFDPLEAVANLINFFDCVQRLPESDYTVQARNVDECKKLFIYKASDDVRKDYSDDIPLEIQSIFSRKWIAIDPKTPSFLHVNHSFAPCCFPVTHNHQTFRNSYIQKTPFVRKAIKPSEKDSPKKDALNRKRKNAKRKSKLNKKVKPNVQKKKSNE